MKTNKIFAAALAGLCAVSTMGVSAFAADEKIETSGAKSYKINAAFQAPTIDVTVPEEIAAVINPYMIAVKIDNVTYEAEGIASPRYTITNNSTEVGINIKATYSAEGLDGIVDEADKATDPAKNSEGKKLAYVTLNAVADTTAGAAATTTLVMDTEEDTDLLLTLEEKASGKANAGAMWIGGATIEDPAEKWSASDKLSINVVLDINPYNPNGGGNGGGGSTELTVSGATMTGTGGTYAIALTTADASAVITLTAPTGKTITNIVDTNTRNTVNVGAGTVTIDSGIRAGDNSTITVTYDDASTATIAITVS
ncbi:MAG: hypothetical protein K2J76_05845 [Oscillospiraceae bacterium]|nr:hypothetical protein [Oscillospiraceae bacterium]